MAVLGGYSRFIAAAKKQVGPERFCSKRLEISKVLSTGEVSNSRFNVSKSIGNVVDAAGRKVPYYPEVPTVLEHLKAQGYTLAVASRTGEIRGANQALQLFNWDKYFTYKEIYPGRKVNHFNQFRKISGIQFQDMLFFDDEYRNIRDLEAQGVTSVLVDNGISFAVVEEGLKAFSSRTS